MRVEPLNDFLKLIFTLDLASGPQAIHLLVPSVELGELLLVYRGVRENKNLLQLLEHSKVCSAHFLSCQVVLIFYLVEPVVNRALDRHNHDFFLICNRLLLFQQALVWKLQVTGCDCPLLNNQLDKAV